MAENKTKFTGASVKDYIAVALLLACLATGDQVPAAESSLRKLEAVGKALFEQDRAAWLATDRLLESGSPDGLRGWVTLPSRKGWEVVFVQGTEDAYCSMLSVRVDEEGAGPLRRTETCEPLAADALEMFRARQTAISALSTRCSDTYNTVVLPHEGKEAAWAVYLLAATKEAGKVVAGGHVRVLVRKGGLEVVDYRQLSKACLELDMPSSDRNFIIVSHFIDDHPIETHVFLSLLHGVELYVLTEASMWSVDKGQFRLVMEGEAFKEYIERGRDSQEKKKGGNDAGS